MDNPVSTKIFTKKSAIFSLILYAFDIFLESDKDTIDIQEKIAYQKEKIEYLESIIKTIVNRNFLIKNIIDWRKFTSGA